MHAGEPDIKPHDGITDQQAGHWFACLYGKPGQALRLRREQTVYGAHSVLVPCDVRTWLRLYSKSRKGSSSSWPGTPAIASAIHSFVLSVDPAREGQETGVSSVCLTLRTDGQQQH